MIKKVVFLILFCCIGGGAMNAQSATVVDSTVFRAMRAYQQRNFNDMRNPIVLEKGDSLFKWAKQYHYVTMMNYAMRVPLEYYYQGDFNNPTDSIKVWLERVRSYAHEYNQTDLYYRVWSSYLINSYLRRGEYTLALVEAQDMLKEAESEENKNYMLWCYFSMTNIYIARNLDDKAQEYRVKQIELAEQYDLVDNTLTLQYSDGAKYLTDHNQLDQAAEYLQKALETASTSYSRWTAYQTYVYYYLARGDYNAARQKFDECRQMFATDTALAVHAQYQYAMEADYYIKLKQYGKALEALENERSVYEKSDEASELIRLDKRQADLLWEMGQKAESGEFYRKYVDEQQKQKEREEEVSTGEFATMLDLQKLSNEKRELEQLSQAEQLRNTRTIVTALVLLLSIVVIFLLSHRRINIRLKQSRDELNEKNRMLLQTEEDLRAAKEQAENSSNMKTVFIQNMSHEIRTPLNSIVGLSAVLADLFADSNDEVKLYASLIDENSTLLLKLISDILDISALDGDIIIEKREIEINNCCKAAIADVQKACDNKGLTVVFEPKEESVYIVSNTERITQVLKNLLNNALKFTQQGRIMLDYTVDNANDTISFVVSDTGIGIAPSDRERIFERFVKLDEFTQGTGLGLPICRIIAEKLGGTISVDPIYTGGARLVFTIPII
jgi:signal transduction histidine kinase